MDQILRPPHARERFVNRHRADGHGRSVDDRLADHGNVAAGGKVHHRVRAVMHGAMQFLEFLVHIRSRGGIADVGVDLAEEGDADAHRLQIAVIDIGGNDRAAARDFIAHQLRREFLALGDVLHLFGNHAQARIMHLRKVTHASIHRRGALFDPCIPHCHKAPVYNNPETAFPPNTALLHCVGCAATCEGGARRYCAQYLHEVAWISSRLW